jgi:chromate transport protein ChrA
MHRTWGGLVAGGLFILPSVFILSALSWVYVTYGDVRFISGIFYGIKPAVVAIVLAAAWRIGSRALRGRRARRRARRKGRSGSFCRWRGCDWKENLWSGDHRR